MACLHISVQRVIDLTVNERMHNISSKFIRSDFFRMVYL